MGKRLIQQARGKGSPTYRSPSHRYRGSITHAKAGNGRVIDIMHCPGHSAPLARVSYENSEEVLMLAPEGIRVNDRISTGEKASIEIGNSTQLKNIPEGTFIYNIENSPGDGGRFCRSAGTFAKLLTHVKNKVIIMLPSQKKKELLPECRATIGIIAGGGKKEKPFVKAGNKYHAMRARNKLYPKVCGLSMNAVDHPFGGSSSHIKGHPGQVSRHAPPGRKVGKISPRRTGRTKK